MSTDAAIPTDPLAALGSSLFITVLSFLPHPSLTTVSSVCHSWRYHSRCNRTGIWRPACQRTGVDPELIRQLAVLDKLHSTQASSGLSKDREEQLHRLYSDWFPTDGSFPSDPDRKAGRDAGEVDWKRVCELHVQEDKNWRFGRCKERWIYPDDTNVAAWRFKVDEEEDTCLITNQTGGLQVVDLGSSNPLFSIPRVRAMAHIEFCKGFVVFDIDGDSSLLVARTRRAVSNSIHPWPSSRKLPDEIIGSTSHIYRGYRPENHILPRFGNSPFSTPPPLPRGALSFYRTITAPVACHAFRARVDGEGVGARAMLGTAGETAVYIWDLDDEDRAAEIINVPESVGEIGVRYLEFDDHYVFLCGSTQLHVLSRRTKSLVLSFPPIPASVRQVCTAAYRVEFTTRPEPLPLPKSSKPNEGIEEEQPARSAVVGRIAVPGWRNDTPGFVEAMEMDTLEMVPSAQPSDNLLEDYVWPPSGRDYDFSACHFNSTDLFCTTLLGQLLIIRDYVQILAIPDPVQRSEAWARQTITICARLPITHLAVDGSHVTARTQNHIFFFDTSSLPTLPLPVDGNLPPIQIYTIMSAHPGGVARASCAQIHKSTIYYTYDAKMDSTNARPMHSPQHVGIVPDRAARAFATSVRGWDFSSR